MLQVGIIGLPNVGKSTLFNALLEKQQALVANYPFATIEPNVGIVAVPDERLGELQKIVQAQEQVQIEEIPIVPATVKFVDIAGLVKGAAEGAGLGNKFLAHIREVDLICHVVRDFKDENIIREGSTNPESDIEVINAELILADLQTIAKADSGKRKADSTELKNRLGGLKKLTGELNKGKLARDVELTEEEAEAIKELQLLTMKPVLYVRNVTYENSLKQIANGINNKMGTNEKIEIDAKLEAELASLSEEEQKEYLQSLGISEPGLNRLIQKAYSMLGLISFLTAGVKEVRAWTIKRGTKAPQAAGVIHTDFEKGFIKAEIIDFNDFVKLGGWKKAREEGKVRFEGKEYVINDGDVVEFKVNA